MPRSGEVAWQGVDERRLAKLDVDIGNTRTDMGHQASDDCFIDYALHRSGDVYAMGSHRSGLHLGE
jgi:hypothetical protein